MLDLKDTIRREATSVPACTRLAKEVEKIELKSEAKRVVLLSNFNLQGLGDCLKTQAFLYDIFLENYAGAYGQWRQEIAGESLYNFNPDIIFVILDLFGVDDSLWHSIGSLNKADLEKKMADLLMEVTGYIELLAGKTKAKIVFGNSPRSARNILGLADSKHTLGFNEFISAFNRALAEKFKSSEQVFIFDFDHWLGNIGKNNYWYSKYLFLGDLRLSPEAFVDLAQTLSAYLVALSGKAKKCIVLDLDNVLWGGVIGEDGLSGIELSPTGRGGQYYYFQQALLGLNQRGVLLAINSKNNSEDVEAVFKNHPYMVLKENNFAAKKINWENKAQNLKELASELNIGLDSLIFIDDDPANRELIKNTLPEVEVINWPEDSALYTDTLLQSNWFSVFQLTSEDKARADMYNQQRERRQLQEKAIDMDSFLRALDIKIEIGPVTDFLLPRTAQLTQKTNQFNLTSRRYQEEDIRAMLSSGVKLWTLDVSDRFGAYGLTGVAIAKNFLDYWEIDTFLLSCRVLGKKIEDQFLGYILSELKKIAPKKVVGIYHPTKKNIQTADFYEKFLFKKKQETDTECVWERELTDFEFRPVEFIDIKTRT